MARGESWNTNRYSSVKLWMENPPLIKGCSCSSLANESICFSVEADTRDRWWCCCQRRKAQLFGFIHSHSALSLLKWGNVPQQQLLIQVTNTLYHTQIHCVQATLNASEYHSVAVSWDLKSLCVETHDRRIRDMKRTLRFSWCSVTRGCGNTSVIQIY